LVPPELQRIGSMGTARAFEEGNVPQ